MKPVNLTLTAKVLIPMWWGGFSELRTDIKFGEDWSLNPHVVGRFFRAVINGALQGNTSS